MLVQATIVWFTEKCLDMIFWIFSSDSYFVIIPFAIMVFCFCVLAVFKLGRF